jgi:DNA primase
LFHIGTFIIPLLRIKLATNIFSMEIKDIKAKLSIEYVLNHYNIETDKHHKTSCPFHEDKTPSFTIYPKTNTFHCFGCGISGDTIEFIQLKENITKHEAILKAQDFIGVPPILRPQPKPEKPTPPEERSNNEASKELPRLAVMSKIAQDTKTSFKRTEAAQAYIKSRKLNADKIEIGYIGRELGKGWNKPLQQSGLKLGILKQNPQNIITPKFSQCIVFFTKNEKGQVTELYARSVVAKPEAESGKHFYLNGQHQGIYPCYPKTDTKKLILTECIIDCATLQQHETISKDYSLIALFGVNGFTAEIEEAIKGLKELEEVILFFDGDKAGKEAIPTISRKLQTIKPEVKITYIETPEGEDINSLAQGHEPEIFTHLINQRKPFSFLTETENQDIRTKNQDGAESLGSCTLAPGSALNTSNPNKLTYSTPELRFTIWGGIEKDNLHRLKVNLLVEHKTDSFKYYQDDVNLYSNAQLQRFIKGVAEELETSSNTVKNTLKELSAQLAEYRLKLTEDERKALLPKVYQMTRAEEQEALAFLKGKQLVKNTLKTIEKTGLVGEQKNGLLLFFLYLSRLMDEPLHAIIFGKSGSGKTYLQTRVSECLPEESLRTITSLTENTLYYSAKDFWKHKVLLIEDLEGVYNAFLPLREFMSKQSITKLTTDKDAKGNNVQKLLMVEGPICVSGATTQESIYEDNANRSFLLIIDETPTHLNEVMQYQRKLQAGLVNEAEQEKAKQILKNSQRLLRKVKIINPYAPQLEIPQCVFKKLRTNIHYLKLIEIVTFYHQHQREVKTDKDGKPYILTTLEDIECANYLVKDTLLRKSDELSGELRNFFESLKTWLKAKDNQNGNTAFYAKDIRKSFRMHPMKLTRHLINLEKRGLLKQLGSNRQNGYEYQVISWDDYEQLKSGIDILDSILSKLKEKDQAKY